MVEDLDVGMKCTKYMLFVANFMFVMIGFLLISIGTTIKAIYGDFELFMEDHYFSPANLAIAIGVIMFCVALFGCVGALKESTCLINLFAVMLAFILILEIAAAIAAYAMRTDIQDTIKMNMFNSRQDYYAESSYVRDAWDFTQRRLHCCGVDDYSDWWLNLPVEKKSNKTMLEWNGPNSCCQDAVDHEQMTTCKIDNIWKTGCLDSLVYIVSECALLLGCGALAVAFIQILGIVFAHMLAKSVRRLKTQSLVEREQNRQRLYEQLARGVDTKPTPVLYEASQSEA